MQEHSTYLPAGNQHKPTVPRRRERRCPPPVNLCACPGCRQHVARLEEFNAQLARENDRLRRELGEGKRAA